MGDPHPVKRAPPQIPPAVYSPRRVHFDEGVLLQPPLTLADLPPGGLIGSFRGLGAVMSDTPTGIVAAFLHDLPLDDLALLMEDQRIRADVQYPVVFGCRRRWWEQP